MSKNGSKLLYLALGAAVGAAVGYIAASDKKEQWMKDINGLVDKIKYSRGKVGNTCKELPDDITTKVDGE